LEDDDASVSADAPSDNDDERYMNLAVLLAAKAPDVPSSPWYPGAPCGAVLVHGPTGNVIGTGVSGHDADHHATRAALTAAGVVTTPLREWAVQFPGGAAQRRLLSECTLYLTSEPSHRRRGSAVPPVAGLVAASGVRSVVIGLEDAVASDANRGAAALHAAGIDVSVGLTVREDCKALLRSFRRRARSKLRSQARTHFRTTGRPLGFLHCSVIDSHDAESFSRNGHAFAKDFGGALLNERNFGAYELAPPPESIWAGDKFDDSEDEEDDFDDDWESGGDSEFTDDSGTSRWEASTDLEFLEEEPDSGLNKNPMMPWYEQVDAVLATFPRIENTPDDDQSVAFRLKSLRWFCRHGSALPSAVDRILVLDASDLIHIPLSNDDPRWEPHLDIEKFWRADGRSPTKVILRRGKNAIASTAARAAAAAAAAAAYSAQRALQAVETGDAEAAAEEALRAQETAMEAARQVRTEAEHIQSLKQRLVDMGVVVETIGVGKPIDVMQHIGERWGYEAVVWRAGCWGRVGVESVIDGAFQWISAHLSVDAVGGRFWQLMLAEQCVQAACGSKSDIQVIAEQDDLNLQYCDEGDPDEDCVLQVDGRPVRHVRIDCRVALVDDKRPKNIIEYDMRPMPETFKTQPKKQTLEAPWFL